MASKSKKKSRGQKTARLGDVFSAAGNEEVSIPEANLVIRTITVKESYPGHRFEEWGDEYKAEAEIELNQVSKFYSTSWYLREDPPGLAWTVGDYGIFIVGSRTGHFLKDRRLILKVEKKERLESTET